MSKIEVNAIEPQSGTTLTLGASGDTVTLAAGALQSGFGRSGSVNWDTTPKTTTPVTAVSGNGYFINTTSIAITVNLPATPAAGDIVAIADYANTSATNNITVGRNGSLIDGNAFDATIKINGQVYTLVYVDATEGWKTVNQTFNQINTASFVAATGGTITTSGDFKIHTFTGPGTFTVTSAGNAGGSNSVDYLVVAGGGSGGTWGGGGGGAGGYRQNFPSPAVAGLPVTAQAYPITVGAGGTGQAYPTRGSATPGSPSIFSTITSAGGGRGAGCSTSNATGGSGGGGTYTGATAGGIPICTGAAGNTPPVSPPQGNSGGNGSNDPAYSGGGGGGASAVGSNSTPTTAEPGGAGTASSITGSPVSYAGGGGSGSAGPGSRAGGTGGAGGGGPGGASGGPNPGTAGTANTGGGGGGAGATNVTGTAAGSGGSGGSGIVVIRYKFQ